MVKLEVLHMKFGSGVVVVMVAMVIVVVNESGDGGIFLIALDIGKGLVVLHKS